MPVNSTNPASSLRSTMPSAYIRETKGIRDVLLSGGDPFTLSTSRLKEIVARLYEIPHVETIRYRVPPPRSSSLSGSMIFWLRCLTNTNQCGSTIITTTPRRSPPVHGSL